MPAWVRARTRLSPVHASWQTGQRQFHCGKAPPAAEPSTMAVRRPIYRGRASAMSGSELGRQIAVDLESDANLDKGRGSPSLNAGSHGVSLSTAVDQRFSIRLTQCHNAARGVAGMIAASWPCHAKVPGWQQLKTRPAPKRHHAKVIRVKPLKTRSGTSLVASRCTRLGCLNGKKRRGLWCFGARAK